MCRENAGAFEEYTSEVLVAVAVEPAVAGVGVVGSISKCFEAGVWSLAATPRRVECGQNQRS